jgi:hypothetical protein
MKKIVDNSLYPAEESSEIFLGDSWSKSEKWADGKTYRWIDGNTAEIFWSGDKSESKGTWEIDVLPFAVKGKEQVMTVLQNDIVLTNVPLENSWVKYNIKALPMKTGNCDMKFIFSYAIQPSNIGLGNDTRNLSAAISSIVYYP